MLFNQKKDQTVDTDKNPNPIEVTLGGTGYVDVDGQVEKIELNRVDDLERNESESRG